MNVLFSNRLIDSQLCFLIGKLMEKSTVFRKLLVKICTYLGNYQCLIVKGMKFRIFLVKYESNEEKMSSQITLFAVKQTKRRIATKIILWELNCYINNTTGTKLNPTILLRAAYVHCSLHLNYSFSAKITIIISFLKYIYKNGGLIWPNSPMPSMG